MTNIGSYTVDDLLQIKNQSVAGFGVEAIAKTLNEDLGYFNSAISDQLSLLATPTEDHTLTYGTSAKVAFQEVDDMGTAHTNKPVAGVNVSFPLKLYKAALGWTTKYQELASVQEVANAYLSVRTGYAEAIQNAVKSAMYLSANYSVVDSIDTGLTLGVKRFLNADSMKIPNSGTRTFTASSHTHYLATTSGSVANADVTSLLNHVAEHSARGLKLFINYSDIATITALTGFKALSSVNMIYNASDATIVRTTGEEDLENKLIGFFGDVEVWTKPFAVDNYWLAVSTQGNQKPLAYRQRKQDSLKGLRFMSEIPGYPLLIQNAEAEFGFGVLGRNMGAVLKIDSDTWADPTL